MIYVTFPTPSSSSCSMSRPFRCRGRARTEISGGVTLDRLPALAATGATFVSVGALTHSAPAADISLEMPADAGSAAS